jgi:hypothetical protein
MSWFPIGPNAVFYPHNPNFTRLSRRNEEGGQGQVANITIDTTYQDAPNRIYVTGAPGMGGGGAFRTDDGGNSWVCISDSLPFPDFSEYPTCFAINPLQPLVYMGTRSGGFYVSSDLGQSWVLLSQLPPGGIFKLVVDPRTAGDPSNTVIYAAITGGLFRSADGGTTFVDVFKTVFGQLSSVAVTSFSAYMPSNGDDRYYVGSPEFTSGAVPEAAGLLFSSDPLNSWQNLCSAGIGLPNLQDNQVSSILVDYCPLNPDRVYAWFLGPLETIAIYTTGFPPTCQSLNCWTQVQTVSAPGPGNMAPFDPFAVAPNSPGDGETDILFFGDGTLNRSPDGGQSWEVEPDYAFHPDHHAYAFYPEIPQGNNIPTFYVGCDGGIAMSDQHCNPAFNAATQATYFNQSAALELDGAAGLGAYRNLNRGRQSSAIYCYASDPSIAALGYIGCQDTGANAGDGSLGWRGLSNGDLTSLAVAPGTQGVAIWGAFAFNGQVISWFIDVGLPSFGGGGTIKLNGVAATTEGGGLCATLDGNCLAGLFLADTPTHYFVARLDQSGNASQISADLGSPAPVLAVHPSNPDILYCATADNRVLTTDVGSTATAQTVWEAVTGGEPALNGNSVTSIAIDQSGTIYVLVQFLNTVGASPLVTPLYQITQAGNWVPMPSTNLPAGNHPYGNLLADPVQPDTLYATNANKVYQISVGSGNWDDISGDLPPVTITDLWIGNIGSTTAPKVLLRAAVYTRGMFECDVTSGAVAPGIALYLRDNFLDLGWLPRCPEGVPNPYSPNSSSSLLYHYQCADIKLDYQQPGSATVQPYFQTDPESPPPITGVIFDQLNDHSQNLPGADQAWIHVQVHNRSNTAPPDPVWVWVIYVSAAAGLPGLFNGFWSQFTTSGLIVPNLPANAQWKSIGAPIDVNQGNGITAATPQVASWQFALPTLASGDPGHYCFVAFVHSTGSASLSNVMTLNVDDLTPVNRQVGQKNVHIVAPLLPHMHHIGWIEEIDFHNPTTEVRETTLVVEARGLPPELALALQFSHLETVKPLRESIRGVARHRLSGEEGFESDPNPRPECRCYENIRRDLAGLKRVRCNSPEHLPLPKVAPEIYGAEPSPRVEVLGVRIPALGKVTALIHVRNIGELEPGSEYCFQVQQEVRGVVTGGSTYIIPIAGEKRVVRHSFPTGR